MPKKKDLFTKIEEFSKSINTEERGINPSSTNQNETDKERGRKMNIRTAITPRVRQVRVKTERKPKKEWSKGNEFPSSKATEEGYKSPNTVIKAFLKAVKNAHPTVVMSDKYFPWGLQTEPAAKAIDWIREVIYRDNDASEADIKAHIEGWISWYVSNKIDKKYCHKRAPLSLQSFYESRSGYLKRNPEASSLLAVIFWLTKSSSLAASPMKAFMANSGTRSQVGRPSWSPRAVIICSQVAGSGAVKLKGP
jgi:hypothetical protein